MQCPWVRRKLIKVCKSILQVHTRFSWKSRWNLWWLLLLWRHISFLDPARYLRYLPDKNTYRYCMEFCDTFGYLLHVLLRRYGLEIWIHDFPIKEETLSDVLKLQNSIRNNICCDCKTTTANIILEKVRKLTSINKNCS